MREMDDVTTVISVIILTSVEMLCWVTTKLATALQMYLPKVTITITKLDAANLQVQVTVRSTVREMCDVTTVGFVLDQPTLAEI